MAEVDDASQFRAALTAARLERGFSRLPDLAPTVQEVAIEVGCEVGGIATSHVLRAGDRAIVAVMSGDRPLDSDKLTTAVGEVVGRADADFVRAAVEWVILDDPPPEHRTPIDVFMDAGLFRFDEIWAMAGNPMSVFRIAPAEFRDACEATVMDLVAT